jgi:hypothetical protein
MAVGKLAAGMLRHRYALELSGDQVLIRDFGSHRLR